MNDESQLLLSTLFGFTSNPLRRTQKPSSYQVLDSNPPLPLPTNTLSLLNFKERINIISVFDTSLDNRINGILVELCSYFEVKTNYSIYATQYLASINAIGWSDFEFDKKLISNIVSIQYKPHDYSQTGALETLPTTFVYNNVTLNTYTIIEVGERKPLIVFNHYYKLPHLAREENNIIVTFDVNQFEFPPALEYAFYAFAANKFAGCEDIPNSTQDVLNSFISNSGVQSSSIGLVVL